MYCGHGIHRTVVEKGKSAGGNKELHPFLRDLVHTRIREADFQKFAGSCLVRKTFQF